MKIGIFDPYLDTLGGGERYMMTMAEYLTGQGHQVDVFWDREKIREMLEQRLGLDLSKVKFVSDIFSCHKNLLEKLRITTKYDSIFYMSDGSIPFLFGKRNFLCFMVPFTKKNGRCWFNRVKLSKITQVISISQFTKKFIDQEYGVKSKIIYPPVSVEDLRPTGTKRNIIISVGRFTQTLHAKKQHFLIKVFKKMVDKGLRGWKLVLAGGTSPEDVLYIKKIKKMAANYPVEILTDVPFPALKKYYGRAKIYWHAAGFGEDENLHPERMEHFGITTVEAMASGCVPVVINKGGQPEIVKPGIDGFLWDSDKELKNATLQLIKSPPLLKKMSNLAVKTSRRFSKEVFCQKIYEII